MFLYSTFLTRRYPSPGPDCLQLLHDRFALADDMADSLFIASRGGRFRVEWLADQNPVTGFLAIGVGIWRDDVFQTHARLMQVSDGSIKSNLQDFGELRNLLPFAWGYYGIFVLCLKSGAVLHVSVHGEVEVEIQCQSLGQFLAGLKPTPLSDDEKSGNELVNYLLTSNDEAVLNADDASLKAVREGEHQRTILHLAAGFDCRTLLQQLIMRGFDPIESDATEKNCFHISAENGSVECMAYLIEHFGQHVDRPDAKGRSPLEAACHKQIPEARTAIHLLRAGAKRQLNPSAWSFDQWLADVTGTPCNSETKAILRYVETGHSDEF